MVTVVLLHFLMLSLACPLIFFVFRFLYNKDCLNSCRHVFLPHKQCVCVNTSSIMKGNTPHNSKTQTKVRGHETQISHEMNMCWQTHTHTQYKYSINKCTNMYKYKSWHKPSESVCLLRRIFSHCYLQPDTGVVFDEVKRERAVYVSQLCAPKMIRHVKYILSKLYFSTNIQINKRLWITLTGRQISSDTSTVKR